MNKIELVGKLKKELIEHIRECEMSWAEGTDRGNLEECYVELYMRYVDTLKGNKKLLCEVETQLECNDYGDEEWSLFKSCEERDGWNNGEIKLSTRDILLRKLNGKRMGALE